MILDDSFKITNYKCFGVEPQGFEKIYPINIIIGKNNSGKSSLIDLIEFITQPNSPILDFGRKGQQSEVLIIKKIKEDEVIRSFPRDTSGGGIPGANFYEYGKQFIGSNLEYKLSKGDHRDFVKLEKPSVQAASEYFQRLLKFASLPFKEYDSLLRINAERDIIPESGTQEIKLYPNGSGATALIRSIINMAKYDSFIIEKTLLSELNKIINPEMDFIDIVVQEDDKAKWEIYLEEKENGRIPLSKMGSGVKTIILVLLNLFVVPTIERKRITKSIFGFEELENNLHPTLLRKLFNYLIEFAITKDSYFFITTHSSLVIDLFASNPNAQILHTSKSGDSSFVTTISSSMEGIQILKDLGGKASDMLLSNGVIWVEGPSDAVYLEFLLQLYSKNNDSNKLGRLNYSIQSLATALWKYSGFNNEIIDFNNSTLQNKIISLAKVNHNHLLILDSDNNYEDKPPSEWETFSNGTGMNKAKLIHESMMFATHIETDLDSNFGNATSDTLFFWVTEGTFESYLKYFAANKGKEAFSRFFDFKEKRGYFEKKRDGSNSSISKVELAHQIVKFAEENVLFFSDFAPVGSSLSQNIICLYNTIKTWN